MKKIIAIIALCLIPTVVQAGFNRIAFKKYSTTTQRATECHVQGGYMQNGFFTPEASTKRVFMNISTAHSSNARYNAFRNYSVTTPVIQIYCYKTPTAATNDQDTAVTVKAFLDMNYGYNTYFPISNAILGTR